MAADGWLAPEHRLTHLRARFAQLYRCHSWSVCRASHTLLLINLHMPTTWFREGWDNMRSREEIALGFFSVPCSSSCPGGESEEVVRSDPSLCSSILHVMPKDKVWCHSHPASEEGLEKKNRLKALDRRAVGLPSAADASSVTWLGESRQLYIRVRILT